MAFNPSTPNVKVGTTVMWINKDSVIHRVVSDSGLFGSANLTNGQSYNYTFNQTGSYPYHCTIHTIYDRYHSCFNYRTNQ